MTHSPQHRFCFHFYEILIQKILKDTTDKEFEAHKSALATKKLERPKQLDTLSDSYWSEIEPRLYNFERQVKEVKKMRSLKKKDILAFYQVPIFIRTMALNSV
jgi:secreted Zn-dependent insulinase-like peptidase